MSTKTSILLTGNNEHWYYESMNDTFVLEIDRRHYMKKDEDGKTKIEIHEGTPLYNELDNIRQKVNAFSRIKSEVDNTSNWLKKG